MIDTIKVAIPLSKNQYTKIHAIAQKNNKWQWIQYQPQTGELRFVRKIGVAELDGESYHREIRWDISECYSPGKTYLTLELSLPKLYYGHNLRLLHGWVDALTLLKRQLDQQLHCRMPAVTEWEVKRLDVCYTWQCPSQKTAQALFNSLLQLKYPHKKARKFDTTIYFPGATYTLKIYLKQPEFKANDRKALLKDKVNLEWVNHLENLSDGVIRIEATLRQKYLRRQNIKTVNDLIEPVRKVELNLDGEIQCQDGQLLQEDEKLSLAILAILCYQKTNGLDLVQNMRLGMETPTTNGMHYSAPEMEVEANGHEYLFPGGTITFRVVEKPVAILQYFLHKFIGQNRGMDEVGKIKERLLSHYKSSKALRLLGFYLHVQRFGVDDAKQLYSETTYYQNKADLKAAGVNLLNPDAVVDVDKQFIDSFKFEIPSPYTTNRFDDFRSQPNLLNEKDVTP